MSKQKHLLVALALEMNQPSGRIIQIGAVLGDMLTGEVVARFSRTVNPHEEIAGRITALTGITPEQATDSPALALAYASPLLPVLKANNLSAANHRMQSTMDALAGTCRPSQHINRNRP